MGKRWMARAAKLAVFDNRELNPFVRPMRSRACGGMRGTCHLGSMMVSSRASFCDSVSKRSSRVATRLRVCASSDWAEGDKRKYYGNNGPLVSFKAGIKKFATHLSETSNVYQPQTTLPVLVQSI
jgi:hypothetical protein